MSRCTILAALLIFTTPAWACGSSTAKNAPPSIALEPTPGTFYQGHARTIRATATDPDGFIRSVTFYFDGRPLGTVENPPFFVHARPSTVGTASIVAVATDDDGATARATLPVIVRECPADAACDEESTVEDALCCVPLPVVHWQSPHPRTWYVAPADIILEVSAHSPEGTVTRVEFFEGTAALGIATSAPYRVVWKAVPAGQHELRVKVMNSMGGIQESTNHLIVHAQ